jgi:hypothetical protein
MPAVTPAVPLLARRLTAASASPSQSAAHTLTSTLNPLMKFVSGWSVTETRQAMLHAVSHGDR